MKSNTPTFTPAPLYSCAECADEYSWPADDLFWLPELSNWICWNCFDDGGLFRARSQNIFIGLAKKWKDSRGFVPIRRQRRLTA